MNDGLIRDLRKAERESFLYKELFMKAADTIEELQRQLDEYHKYDTFLWVHGIFKEVPGDRDEQIQ